MSKEKILSLAFGVALLALAVFAPAGLLSDEARLAIGTIGGGLIGLPFNPLGKKAPPALALLFAGMLGVSQLACSSTQQAVETARTAGKVAELSVPIALDALDFAEKERARLVEAGMLTPDDNAKIVEALDKAKATLQKLEAKQVVAREELLDALKKATFGVRFVEGAGAKLPKFVGPALEVWAAVLGESS